MKILLFYLNIENAECVLHTPNQIKRIYLFTLINLEDNYKLETIRFS